jgi:hypothetical protein
MISSKVIKSLLNHIVNHFKPPKDSIVMYIYNKEREAHQDLQNSSKQQNTSIINKNYYNLYNILDISKKVLLNKTGIIYITLFIYKYIYICDIYCIYSINYINILYLYCIFICLYICVYTI